MRKKLKNTLRKMHLINTHVLGKIIPMKLVLLVLLIIQLIAVVHANTEVIGIDIPKDFQIAPYTAVDNSNDPIKLSALDETYTVSPKLKRTINVDLLKFTKRKSHVIKNSRNLSPVSFMVELVNVEADTNYNFKVSWSALNPVDVELSQLDVPPDDDNPYSRAFLKIKLRPNYYASTPVHIEDYLNDIIIDVECINGSLIGKLIRWLVSCLVVGIALAKYLTTYIEEEQ